MTITASNTNISFNIYTQPETTITLSSGAYYICLSGGYSVSFGSDFQVSMIDMETHEQIALKKTMRVRTVIHGKRMVRLFELRIMKHGRYLVRVEGANNIEVKRSVLNIVRLMQKKVDASEVNLVISTES